MLKGDAISESRLEVGRSRFIAPSMKIGSLQQSWSYLYTHAAKIEKLNETLQRKFTTFIHKTAKYHKEGKKISHEDRPTISGLIFIKGLPSEVQNYLNEKAPGAHLSNDCATGKPAVISDYEMNLFIKISDMVERDVRFIAKPLAHYSDGHTLVTITSGLLKGISGYVVRIARDKHLVTRIGNMTVAIGGITRESFENADEYLKLHANALTANDPLLQLIMPEGGLTSKTPQKLSKRPCQIYNH